MSAIYNMKAVGPKLKSARVLQLEINNISDGSIKNIGYVDGPCDGDGGYGGGGGG
jgi:hypothetical protein